jgi:hypothetical protein
MPPETKPAPKPVVAPRKKNLAPISPNSHSYGAPLGSHALARLEAKRPAKASEPERYCSFAVSEVVLLASHKPALIVLAIMRAYGTEVGMRLDEIGLRSRFGRPRTERAIAKLMTVGFIEALPPNGKVPLFRLTERGRGDFCHPLKGGSAPQQPVQAEPIETAG